MKRVQKKDIEQFYKAIVRLRNSREVRLFLRDILTENEIKEFAIRLNVARMIAERVPYTQIIKTTGLSSRTIARVARWVKKGTGGFKMALDRTRRVK
jgi:TrpR-related protein YerC/YecD